MNPQSDESEPVIKTDPTQRRDVPAVAGALRILDYLAHVKPEARVSEIARHLAMNKSTCFNILATLQSAQVVVKHPVYPVYRLGPKLIELGSASRRRLSQGLGLRDAISALVDEIELTCVIGHVFADGSGIVIVDRVVPRRPSVSTLPIGHVVPMTGPAMGRAVLSARDDHDAIEVARQLKLIKTGEEAGFIARLEAIRAAGYEAAFGEWAPDVNAVAAVAGGPPGAEIVLCVIGYKRHLPASAVRSIGGRLARLVKEVDSIADSMLMPAAF